MSLPFILQHGLFIHLTSIDEKGTICVRDYQHWDVSVNKTKIFIFMKIMSYEIGKKTPNNKIIYKKRKTIVE